MSKILIVEDEAELGAVIQRHLEGEGHEVALVGGGIEALEGARREMFELIVLDLMLPGLDGLEVARRVRQPANRATSPAVPILMLTARAEEADRVLGFEVGADDYLTKPFSLREFLARVRAMLRRARITLEESKPDLIRIGRFELDTQARAVRIEDKLSDLTPREYDLLLMLARQIGRAHV